MVLFINRSNTSYAVITICNVGNTLQINLSKHIQAVIKYNNGFEPSYKSKLFAGVVVFTSSRCQSGCLLNPSIPALTAHAPKIRFVHTTSRDFKARIKMPSVAGRCSLVTGWNRLLLKPRPHSKTSKTRQYIFYTHRHGAEEIYFRHRARTEELRSCVRNSVDHGQRWVPRRKRCAWLSRFNSK